MAKKIEVNGWTKDGIKVWIKAADVENPNHRAALTRALLYLYARQTADEQSQLETNQSNGEGFTGVDAPFLSSVAQKAIEYKRDITPKQAVYVAKKLAKYSGQLMDLLNTPKPPATA